MQESSKTKGKPDDWVTIRDFDEGEDGFTHPKYEVLFVDDVDRTYVEDDVVLVKKVSPMSEAEHIYHLPRDVFDGVAGRL